MTDGRSKIFSQEWAEALGAALNRNVRYREAAAGWEGSLAFALVSSDGRARHGVFLDLMHGECRGARRATPDDLESSVFLLRADAGTWTKLLDGSGDPLFAIMTGKLELARGSLASLLPFPAAARQLVVTAASLGGEMPVEPA